MDHCFIELDMMVRHTTEGVGIVFSILFPRDSKEVFVDVRCPDNKKRTWNVKEIESLTINNT
jgi:hypothetical protein